MTDFHPSANATVSSSVSAETGSAYHLNGIFGNSGANSNGTGSSRWKIFGKKVILSRYFLFLAFTGMPENFCTICPLLQCQALHGNTSEKEC